MKRIVCAWMALLLLPILGLSEDLDLTGTWYLVELGEGDVELLLGPA